MKVTHPKKLMTLSVFMVVYIYQILKNKTIFYLLKESKGSIPKRKAASADKHKFAVFLLFTRLIEVRELRLFGHCDLFVLVGLVVEFESVVGISEKVLSLLPCFTPYLAPTHLESCTVKWFYLFSDQLNESYY